MHHYLLVTILLFSSMACAQVPVDKPTTVNPEFDKKISHTISFTVPTISPNDLKQMKAPIILDAREREEYEVSHIKGARYIGYKKFDESQINDIPKDANIVLYCSIGYRSEKLGERLQKAGFKNVHNLYGSIFEWVNQGNPVVDKDGKPTKKLHTYNRNWSQWVEEGKAEKVW